MFFVVCLVNTEQTKSYRRRNAVDRKIRVLVAKPGLDGHDRGAKVIARSLRDAGMEVIYSGLRQTPEQIVAAAIEEDVDMIAVSILSGAHNYLLPKIKKILNETGAGKIGIVAGGVIPDKDIPGLKQKGILEVYTPGTKTQDVIDFIRNTVRQRALA